MDLNQNSGKKGVGLQDDILIKFCRYGCEFPDDTIYRSSECIGMNKWANIDETCQRNKY